MTVSIPTGVPTAPTLVGRPGFLEAAVAYRLISPGPADKHRWRHLYRQFAEHYTVPVDADHQDVVWSWLMDPEHPLECLLAVDDSGQAWGLAHFRAFPRPLSGTVGCFLDDLLVDSEARGGGCTDALLHGLRQVALDRGWTVVRWLTADNNYRARRAYDAFALRTMWVTYDMPPANAAVQPSRPAHVGAFELSAPTNADKERWRHLYRQYAEHYKVPVSEAHQDVVWSWITDPDHPEKCLLARDADGVAQGLAHYRPFTRPLAGSVGGYLDDLLVDRDARGTGVADALLEGLRDVAAERGWSLVRWITADDNHRARGVYDAYATRTMWVTYDMTPGELPAELKEVLA